MYNVEMCFLYRCQFASTGDGFQRVGQFLKVGIFEFSEILPLLFGEYEEETNPGTNYPRRWRRGTFPVVGTSCTLDQK